jgi:alpha-beta hydrolase superfamily lysophospholipase
MSFGSFNKKFKPNRTAFDWLTRNEAIVDAYVADPLCGFVCTTSFFREFTHHLAILDHKLFTIRYDLPIYIFAGEKDPVGNFGEGPRKLYEQYKNKGNIVDLEMKLYSEDRHETLNELNRDEVIADCIHWILKHD